jgi:hypothetical protein
MMYVNRSRCIPFHGKDVILMPDAGAYGYAAAPLTCTSLIKRLK